MSVTGLIDSRSVFLVSGGGRGITAHCIIGMAQHYGCRFVLLGRTSMSEPVPSWAEQDLDEATLKQRVATALRARGEKVAPTAIQREYEAIRARREIVATLQAIEQAGSAAEYVVADITDIGILSRALAPVLARHPSISGLIHGAGTLADKRIEHKQAADFDAVFGPKVHGLANLLACVPAERLRYLVLFSSAAGFYGNPGQADYAIANEILNKIAFQLKRSHPACTVLALNWGPWDGGMVTPALKQLFEQRQIMLIPVAAGVQVFLDALSGGDNAAVQLLAGSPVHTPATAPRPERLVFRTHRRLSLAANPFLQDHRIGENAVLPVTCAVTWLADSCEQFLTGYYCFRCEDFQVLKGIVLDDTLAPHYVLELTEIGRSDEQDEIRFAALVSSVTPSGTTRYHYQARLTLRRDVPQAPLYTAFDLRKDGARDGRRLYRDGTLFHGPSFQGVVDLLNISPHRLTLRCRLPAIAPATQGQFPVRTLNPYLADVGLQALLVWARHTYKAASLPLSTACAEQYRPLRFGTPFFVSMEVRSSDPNHVAADVITHDEQGRVYLRFTDARVAISRDLDRLFRPAAMSAPTQ